MNASSLPRFRRLPLLAALFALGLSGADAAPVALRLEPADPAPVLAEIDDLDPRWQSAEPLPAQGPRPAGWRRVTWDGPITGYVPRRALGKDLSVRDGTNVRLSPSDGAALVVRLADGSAATFGRLVEGDRWAEVVVRAPVVLYGYVPPPRVLPAPAPAPLAPPPPAPVFVPVDPTPIITPAEAAAAVAGSNRTVAGRLREVPTWSPSRRNHRFEIVDPRGRRLAFVSLQGANLTGTLARYLDQEVTAWGRIELAGRQVVLDARVLNLRQPTAAPR